MAYEADRRVLATYQEHAARVTDRIKAYAALRFTGLGSWRDDDIKAFVSEIVPLVQSGQVQVGQLTNSYLDALARVAGLEPTVAVSPVLDARGVPPAEVYRRPAVTVYTALSQGKLLDEAVMLGVHRLQDIIAMDMQLTHTRTAHKRMRGGGVVGYRRALTGRENCALCTLASSQRYHRGDLMPIHPGCDCTVLPIYGTHDPGQVIGPEAYEKAMRALDAQGALSHGGTQGRLRDATDLMVRDHGEFGPTLTWRGQKFTGPDDL